MNLEVLEDVEALAQRGARVIAEFARDAILRRERFVFAASGGHTPWLMLRALGTMDLPWERMHIVQVDERIAPAGDPARNLTHLQESLLEHCPLRPEQIYPMPVEASNLQAAAVEYAAALRDLAGSPPVLDLVHLGLGSDGHTASLLPGDPVLDITDRDVGLAGPYEGRRRMTLTFPTLDRARGILWLVAGAEKANMLLRLCRGDRSIPAGRVNQKNALVLADRASGALLASLINDAR